MFTNDEPYEDSSTVATVDHNNTNRSVKAVKSTRSRIAPHLSISRMSEDHDYNETLCPSFDLHLYAHIDRSSINQCIFTPVPHETVSQDEFSQSTSHKRKFDSIEGTRQYVKNVNFGNDNGELAEIIYDMDKRLDQLTRTCNGLRSSLHTITKMVSQLVQNQTQNTATSDYDDASQLELPYIRSSLNVSTRTSPNRNKRARSTTDTAPLRPTEFLCRLIRKYYSTEEIVAGINHDDRLDRIKQTVADRFFSNDSERFETFWNREAHQSILGQARAQRFREKKARGYMTENQ